MKYYYSTDGRFAINERSRIKFAIDSLLAHAATIDPLIAGDLTFKEILFHFPPLSLSLSLPLSCFPADDSRAIDLMRVLLSKSSNDEASDYEISNRINRYGESLSR